MSLHLFNALCHSLPQACSLLRTRCWAGMHDPLLYAASPPPFPLQNPGCCGPGDYLTVDCVIAQLSAACHECVVCVQPYSEISANAKHFGQGACWQAGTSCPQPHAIACSISPRSRYGRNCFACIFVACLMIYCTATAPCCCSEL